MKGIDRERVASLVAMLGSDNAHEAESARLKLIKELKRVGLSFSDLANLVDPARKQPQVFRTQARESSRDRMRSYRKKLQEQLDAIFGEAARRKP